MRVGVIGAGTMGAGIAQAFASGEDVEVRLCDLTTELATRGRDRIAAGLRGQVAKGRMSQEAADAIVGRVSTGEVDALADCALVIEAVLEEMGAKRELFARLDGICGPEAILATNTSTLSVTEMARGLRHPLVGMHFFNPAPVMKLVEVTAGADTPPDAVDAVTRLAESIGKTPVRVAEAPGFVVNRVLIPMINEAIGVLADGTASAEDIDTAMKFGANHPIGPLALGDLVGLDVVLAIMEILQGETGDPKYRPHPLLRKMVRAGRLGRKSGRGIYQYAAAD